MLGRPHTCQLRLYLACCQQRTAKEKVRLLTPATSHTYLAGPGRPRSNLKAGVVQHKRMVELNPASSSDEIVLAEYLVYCYRCWTRLQKLVPEKSLALRYFSVLSIRGGTLSCLLIRPFLTVNYEYFSSICIRISSNIRLIAKS